MNSHQLTTQVLECINTELNLLLLKFLNSNLVIFKEWETEELNKELPSSVGVLIELTNLFNAPCRKKTNQKDIKKINGKK